MTSLGYYTAPNQHARAVRLSHKDVVVYEDHEGAMRSVKADSFARWLRKFGGRVCSCDPRFRGAIGRDRECDAARGFRGTCNCRCHRYGNGILKITMRDNDYTDYVRRAAIDLMENIREHGSEAFVKAVDNLDLLRNALVIGTYGHKIAILAHQYRRMYGRQGLITKRYKSCPALADPDVVRYLDANLQELLEVVNSRLKIELLPEHTVLPDWDNGEVVYINFSTHTVITK